MCRVLFASIDILGKLPYIPHKNEKFSVFSEEEKKHDMQVEQVVLTIPASKYVGPDDRSLDANKLTLPDGKVLHCLYISNLVLSSHHDMKKNTDYYVAIGTASRNNEIIPINDESRKIAFDMGIHVSYENKNGSAFILKPNIDTIDTSDVAKLGNYMKLAIIFDQIARFIIESFDQINHRIFYIMNTHEEGVPTFVHIRRGIFKQLPPTMAMVIGIYEDKGNIRTKLTIDEMKLARDNDLTVYPQFPTANLSWFGLPRADYIIRHGFMAWMEYLDIDTAKIQQRLDQSISVPS